MYCVKCGQEISADSTFCEKCGAAQGAVAAAPAVADAKAARKANVRGIIFAVLASIVLLWMCGKMAESGKSEGSSASTPEASSEPPIVVSAPELYEAYKANEVAADNLFKGKSLQVSGVVEKIAKDIMDNIYVTLRADGGFGSIQCMLPDNQAPKASTLSQGEQITVRGVCKGKMMNVLLDPCSLH